MSKPGKVLKGLCKKLGIRLTVKRGKKRVYKSVAILKKQCAKKKKKVKRKRKFGASVVSEVKYLPNRVEDRIVDFLAPTQKMVSERKRRVTNELFSVPSLEHVFSPDSNYRLVSANDLVPGKRYKFTLLPEGRASGLEELKPRVKTYEYNRIVGQNIVLLDNNYDNVRRLSFPLFTVLKVFDLDYNEVELTGPPNTSLQFSHQQMTYNVFKIMEKNPGMSFSQAMERHMIRIGMEPRRPIYSPYYPEYRPFGKRKKKVVKKKKVSTALKKMCKKYKVRLTVKRGGKRVYKSEKVLKKQCKTAMKKKK